MIFSKIIPLLFLAVIGIGCSGHHSSHKSQEGAFREIKADSQTAIIQLPQGTIAGYLDGEVYTFKGVPYAKAERFMPPVEADSWEGIRSCRYNGPSSPHGIAALYGKQDQDAFTYGRYNMCSADDCQNVNVWTRGLSDGKRRPVMVWLHGGGFRWGSGYELPQYDGYELSARGDVVVVCVTHRLGVVGFLDLSAYGSQYASSGNAGMLDIVAALKWVNQNIEKFGGNPNNVTVFGQSGGGGKVSTLLTMPSAKGLFHKAIIQSGSMLTQMTAENSRKFAATILDELGLKPEQSDKLKTMPWQEIDNASDRAAYKLTKELKNGFGMMGCAPHIDGTDLLMTPREALSADFNTDIPLMVGTNLNEFQVSATGEYNHLTWESANALAKTRYGEKAEAYMAAFRKAFPHARPKDAFETDFKFRAMAVEQARIKASGRAPVYLYRFDWQSPLFNETLRACHNMEIAFAFHNVNLARPMTGGTVSAHRLQDLMADAWINFARTGNPNHAGLPKWEPYTQTGGMTLIFDETCTTQMDPDIEILKILEDIQ
mgnify:CR=1 FL=1